MKKTAVKTVEGVGDVTIQFLEEIGQFSILFLHTLKGIFTGQINPRLMFEQMGKIGIDSLPIGIISASFVGMVFAVQVATEFVRFGASRYVGGVMAIAVARELAPALTGIVIASRVAASIAAEIGAMKVTEQIDAIVALGSSPIKYLVVPRFLACTFMLPLLIIMADLFAFLGGYFVAVFVIRVNSSDYMQSAQSMLTLRDIYGGVFKGFVFGMLLAVVACYKGLHAKGGAKGVGEATTNSVVASLIALFIANYFLTVAVFK